MSEQTAPYNAHTPSYNAKSDRPHKLDNFIINTDYLNGQIKHCVRFTGNDEGGYSVETPFYFGDGDGIVVTFKQDNNGKWHFTDDTHTFFHLRIIASPLADLRLPPRTSQPQLPNWERICARYNIQLSPHNEIVRYVESDYIDEALYDFIEALLTIITTVDLMNDIEESKVTHDRQD